MARFRIKHTLLIAILITAITAFPQKPDLQKFERLTGKPFQTKGSDKSTLKGVWDQKFARDDYVYGKGHAPFLEKIIDSIPANQKILDIGAGEGRNSVFMAKFDHQVIALDISGVALRKAKALAQEMRVRIELLEASVFDYPFKRGEYDMVLLFYFVDDKVMNIVDLVLKTSGFLVFEAVVKDIQFLDNFKNFKILKLEKEAVEGGLKISFLGQKVP